MQTTITLPFPSHGHCKAVKSINGIADSVKRKNVVITGASTGIGEELAYQYARLGANVVITARREQRLKEVLLLRMTIFTSCEQIVWALSLLERSFRGGSRNLCRGC